MMGCSRDSTMYSSVYGTRMITCVTSLKYDMYNGVYNIPCVQVCIKTLGRCLAGKSTWRLHRRMKVRSGSRINNHG